jgi:hypothetical protein
MFLEGLDLLGLAKFPKIALTFFKNSKKPYALGVFAGTFGAPWGAIERIVQTGKCPLVRVQGPWTNHLYDPKKHDADIFRVFERVKKLCHKYPHITWQFSPVCECDSSSAAWVELFKRLARADEGVPVQLVCSVGPRGKLVDGVVAEVHGGGAYNYSFDGTSAVDADVEKMKDKHKKSKVFFMWHPSFNLKFRTTLSGDEPANVKKNDSAPPKQRIAKPNQDILNSVVALFGSRGKTSLPKNTIWKSHSDRSSVEMSGREGKPVLISTEKSGKAALFDGNKLVLESSPSRVYIDGRYRYDFPKMGYKIASKPLTVKVGNKVIGSVNPGFRDGTFR